jgi:geranylgeranyl diphosphate synthase type II
LSLDDLVRDERDRFEAVLRTRCAELAREIGVPAELAEAMRYSLLAGGKRIRPLLVLESARAATDGALDAFTAARLAEPAALAVEHVHTYSLIHDDLPALDNDVLRRGRPTLHMAYDEATAILAGDALLTEAFGLVAAAPHNAAEQCAELAAAIGARGMVGGQVDDLANEDGRGTADLAFIHHRKTGQLLAASCALGGLAVGAPQGVIDTLRAYGLAVGRAFQIVDDVLDATGDPSVLGKPARRDAERGKVSYATRFGADSARGLAREAAEQAAALAGALGPGGTRLSQLAFALSARER